LRETPRYQNLWDLIVNNDDICFKHVLPRLNPTDLKFLYGVNTETRALVKRSSRKRELKWKFKIEEMSSISTLEFVWENKSLWPRHWTETIFCEKVAYTNKLEFLKWAREEKKCKWNRWTIDAAAEQGNLEMVKYCVATECPIGMNACTIAASERSSRVPQILTRRSESALGFVGFALCSREETPRVFTLRHRKEMSDMVKLHRKTEGIRAKPVNVLSF
jgi:hypothetical protein